MIGGQLFELTNTAKTNYFGKCKEVQVYIYIKEIVEELERGCNQNVLKQIFCKNGLKQLCYNCFFILSTKKFDTIFFFWFKPEIELLSLIFKIYITEPCSVFI